MASRKKNKKLAKHKNNTAMFQLPKIDVCLKELKRDKVSDVATYLLGGYQMYGIIERQLKQ